jgi:hypothetical protein
LTLKGPQLVQAFHYKMKVIVTEGNFHHTVRIITWRSLGRLHVESTSFLKGYEK